MNNQTQQTKYFADDLAQINRLYCNLEGIEKAIETCQERQRNLMFENMEEQQASLNEHMKFIDTLHEAHQNIIAQIQKVIKSAHLLNGYGY
ncbi:MAG: hypothetical protein CL609_25900 [Anaerolineaceae bacterium]|jgi:CRISPR/Cas system-associated exonuclease Cas4 (RecB family)|nr:hypothetical protein [Anaerolineaceae bacterium]|tara:strand:- start:20 stop:292 length:273 start_codon:yes stop_codon:yes gene_type:complete